MRTWWKNASTVAKLAILFACALVFWFSDLGGKTAVSHYPCDVTSTEHGDVNMYHFPANVTHSSGQRKGLAARSSAGERKFPSTNAEPLGANCAGNWDWQNALDPDVWLSTLSPTHEPVMNVDAGTRWAHRRNEKFEEGAFHSGCRATNVLTDGPQVYLVPRPTKRLQAVRDLFDCCLARAPGQETNWGHEGAANQCSGSVSAAVCACFNIGVKYAPAVWFAGDDHGRVARVVEGTAWLMHFWTYCHHPGHFIDKMLEVHGMHSTRCNEPGNNAWMPRTIDALVSVDFPLKRENLTDYEQVVARIVEAGLARAASPASKAAAA